MKSGENYRMLDHHPYTTAEQDHVTVEGKRHDGKVHADGIALTGRTASCISTP